MNGCSSACARMPLVAWHCSPVAVVDMWEPPWSEAGGVRWWDAPHLDVILMSEFILAAQSAPSGIRPGHSQGTPMRGLLEPFGRRNGFRFQLTSDQGVRRARAA
jgi:hypothetical protein